MEKSYFTFVKNDILRENIDLTFNHIINLSFLTINIDDELKSGFYKTMIIHTASIVEAILFYILDKKFTDKDIANHFPEWKLNNKSVLYVVEEGLCEIVAGKYEKVESKTIKEKMNLGQISNFLKKNKILTKSLFEKIDEIRVLRNSQHISTHKEIKRFNKGELEKAFAIAGEVKEFCKGLDL